MKTDEFDHLVAIIGTGFSGMGVSIALDRVGISAFILLEKSDDIGGTWRDNQYPGACCDVASQLYSFSFELNPDWSRRFSPAPEIHAYQKHVMEKYKLVHRTRCGFEVSSATYSNAGWDILSTTGERIRARYLISAIGALHIPHKPEFPGLTSFRGKVMHSAEWDKSYDVAGKKLVVIGSAASAVQIVPQVAKIAAQVSVLQRTPNYFLMRKDRAVSPFRKRWFRRLPMIQRLARWRQYWDNDLRQPAFKNKPGLIKSIMKTLVFSHLHKQVKDPDLLKKLTPDYQIGCKRVLLSDDFLPALQRQNVTLVTDGIDHFSENGLTTTDGTNIDADLVVLATGFQVTKLFGEMAINGPNGLTMEQYWAGGIRAHRSVAVDGFPNLFLIYGPNSGLGHSSIIIMIEAQAAYIARLLKTAVQSGKPLISVRPEAEIAYNKRIQLALDETVWNTSCNSWYKDENGHKFSLWPYSTTRFIREMRRAPMDEYTFQ